MNSQMDSTGDAGEILVAEDSPTQAEQLRYLLERRSYRVVVANTGKQALAFLGEHKPALVMSDIVMPEMSGYELCQQIKADESTWDIPVILVTSLSNPEDVLEGLACGADSFITKPYSEDYLLAHVQQILANRIVRRSQRVSIGMEIIFAGKRRFISADQQQMLTLLISTYEAAFHRNAELVAAQAELRLLNEHLETRTAELSAEIIERERLQAELRALSLRDELTGLHNRRGFMTLAEQHWRLALRTRQEFVVLYLDMDGLKTINDTFGHAQGDQALRDAGRVMVQTFRESDILARLGGDEFTVLFTDCDLTIAKDAIARLQENLNWTNATASRRYNLSLSVGMAHFDPDHPASLDDLLKQADAEMYVRKQQRRNRVG